MFRKHLISIVGASFLGATLFATNLFAVIAITGDAALSRGTSTSFKLNVTVDGITALDTTENGYMKRLKIIIPKNSATKVIPIEDAVTGDTDPAFEANGSQEVDLSDDEKTAKATFTFTVTEVIAGALAAAIEESKLKITVGYTPGTGEGTVVDKEIIATKDASVANEAPAIKSVKGGFHNITATWKTASTIAYTDGTTASAKAPASMSMYVINKASFGRRVGLAGLVFDPAEDSDTEEVECVVDLTAKDGEDCVVCGSDDNAALSYLNDAQIQKDYSDKSEVQIASDASNSGVVVASELTVGDEYVVILGYQPTSLKRSACYLATPTENTSMVEFTEDEDASLKDPRCFIATAAYGSSLHADVDTLRWFRDSYLMRSQLGRAFVNSYYEYSEPVANVIREHEWLRTVTRGILYLPMKAVTALKELGE